MNRSIRKWARIIHRDLGFLMVGVTVIYAISGILLNHMNGEDPAYNSESVKTTIQKGYTAEQLENYWIESSNEFEIKKINAIDENHLRIFLNGGIGVYTIDTGDLIYETHKKRAFVYWINKLHYNRIDGWFWIGDLFAGSLILFAITSLVMVAGKNGLAGRGKWYLLIGLLIPIIYILLS